MGAELYSYFVPYQADIGAALRELREQVFQTGRYYPTVPFPDDMEDMDDGPKHANIDEARMAAAEEGTHSILDLDRISEEPDFCAASPVAEETLRRLYGTTQPTREQVEDNEDFMADVDRGHGVYLITYEDGKPDQIYFGGYSFD